MTNDSNNEIVLTSVTINERKIHIAGACRTPSMNSTENEDFVNFLSSKLNNCKDFLLIGDLNYPGIDWNNLRGKNRQEN